MSFCLSVYAIKFLILVAIVFLSYTIGYFLTWKLYLPKYSDFFAFKAFTCRPCCTFHTNWLISTFISLCFMDWIMLSFGILFSFGIFILLYLDEKGLNVEE